MGDTQVGMLWVLGERGPGVFGVLVGAQAGVWGPQDGGAGAALSQGPCKEGGGVRGGGESC